MNDRSEIGALLSAYGDGELSPAEGRRLQEMLASDPELALRLADQSSLSMGLRLSLDLEAEEAKLDSFADEVMAQLPAQLPGLAAAETRAEASPSLFGRLGAFFGELFEVRKLQIALGAATVAAAAFTVPYLSEWREGERLAAVTIDGVVQGGGRVMPLTPPAAESSASVLSVEAGGDYETMLYKTSGGTTIIYVREVQ